MGQQRHGIPKKTLGPQTSMTSRAQNLEHRIVVQYVCSNKEDFLGLFGGLNQGKYSKLWFHSVYKIKKSTTTEKQSAEKKL